MGRELRSWLAQGAFFLLAFVGVCIIKANKGTQYQGGNSWIGYAVLWAAVAGMVAFCVFEIWRSIRR
jgi:hypothetical protein